MYDCYIGKNTSLEADPNTTDIQGPAPYVMAHNCDWNNENMSMSAPFHVVSTSHDMDRELFKIWDGRRSYDTFQVIESETTITYDSSRQSVKFTTHANTTALEQDRLDFLLAAWPATHGDTLDVTVYVYGTAGDKVQIHVDPESHYGTTQTEEHTIGVSNTWEQIDGIPTYTVNTAASEKMGIPIIVRCEEASKTFYIDTLSVT